MSDGFSVYFAVTRRILYIINTLRRCAISPRSVSIVLPVFKTFHECQSGSNAFAFSGHTLLSQSAELPCNRIRSDGSMSAEQQFDFDFVVVGSGFGGSVSALRLAEKGYRVAVIEMGRRWTPENLPKTNWSLHRWFWRPGLALRGFFSMRFFRHVTILHGCAVGGGSITYASTLLRPPDKVWQNGSWKGLAHWEAEMPRHYDTASRMLGVTENKILGPADHLLKEAADAVGVGATFYRTSVGIFQSPEGEAGGVTYADPYFNGEGPPRTTCSACGGCMMGCRHGAKNTLDQNYLYLAEKRGAQILAETKVVDVRPLNHKEMAAAVTRSTPCTPLPGLLRGASASPAAVSSLPLPRSAPWNCSSSSRQRVSSRHQRPDSAIAFAPTPNR